MKLLVVSPDYASHALPLIQIAAAWQRAHGPAVVATGTATRPLVEAEDLGWTDLRLGRGSNDGVIEATTQPVGEDDHLRAFFDATRSGPVATLRYQSDARRHDLLFAPDAVLDRLAEIVAAEQPDRIAVDHIAFGARLALHALGRTAATVVVGHPSALPAAGEVFGAPSAWPTSMRPDVAELAELHACCRQSVDELAATSAELLGRRAPGRPAAGDLTSTPGRPTIYVYPPELHAPGRALPAGAVSVGSLVRTEGLADTALPTGTGTRVTVAFGSFLSARGDVLATVVRAAHAAGWRLAIAHGSTPLAELGPLPPGAVAARHLPLVALLEHTDVVIHHGGNGSLTEAAAAGVPMLVLPFSTDQFAGGAAVERVGVGRVLAPNSVSVDALVDAVREVASEPVVVRARELAAAMRRHGGAAAAAAAIAATDQAAPPSDQRINCDTAAPAGRTTTRSVTGR